MRSAASPLAVFVVLVAATACGGKVVEQVGGAAPTTDAASSTTTATSATTNAASSSSTGLTCKDLRNEILGAESRAQICWPPDGDIDCSLTVESVCCTLTMNPANVGWVELHAELMAELKDRPECAPDADYCFMQCPPLTPGECTWDSRGAAMCRP